MRTVPLVLPAVLLISGCATYTVKHDYDTSTNFHSYRNFQWYAASKRARGQGAGGSAIMDRRVQATVEAQLKAKGFTACTGPDEPDFLVTYYPIYRDRKYRTTTSVGFGGGWQGRRFGYGVGTRFSEVHRYTEGTLVVEIVDGKRNQLVWQSAAVGALTRLDNPEEAQEQVAKAVAEMLEKFPPK